MEEAEKPANSSYITKQNRFPEKNKKYTKCKSGIKVTCCILFLNHSHHYFVINIDDIYVNNLVFLLFILIFCCFRQIVCYLLMLQINIFVELRFYCCCFSYIYYRNGPEVTSWTADQRYFQRYFL